MSQMFKIGEFSKIAQVSIHLLRHYDRIDLLKPVYTDAATSYRYYSIEQLERLNRIMALKEMGLSLEQTKQLLDDAITIPQIQAMLQEKRRDLTERITRDTIHLRNVESRLLELERKVEFAPEIPVLKQIPQQHYLALYEHFTPQSDVGTLFWNAYQAVRDAGIEATFSMGIFHGDAFQDEEWDWHYGYLVTEDAPQELMLADERKLTLQKLPAVTQMITTVQHGGWQHLHRGYQAIGRWLHQHGYEFAGAGREVYIRLRPPELMHENITEIQFPVKPLS